MDPWILCYHGISSSWSNPTAVSPSAFRRQIQHLVRRGYSGTTLSGLAAKAEDAAASRRVAVTFDDGYRSILQAKPILDEFGFPATVFVVTSFAESGELLSWPGVDHWLTGPEAEEMRPLVWEELDELAAAGWEVGSHTVTHPWLTALDEEALGRELAESRATIANRLGRCDVFAYPYGAFDARISRAARAAGYRVACAVAAGRRGDLFALQRVGVYERDTPLRLRVKLSLLGMLQRRVISPPAPPTPSTVAEGLG